MTTPSDTKTHPRISNEIDRKAYEAGANIRRFARYRTRITRLDDIKNTLRNLIIQNFPRATVHRVEIACNAACRHLEKGKTFEDAYQFAVDLLTDTPA